MNKTAAAAPKPIAKISLLSVIIAALATGCEDAGKFTITRAILSRTGAPLSFTDTVKIYLSSINSSGKPVIETCPIKSTANKLKIIKYCFNLENEIINRLKMFDKTKPKTL